MVYYVGFGCYFNGDDVVMKLIFRVFEGNICKVFRRLNDFSFYKFFYEFF